MNDINVVKNYLDFKANNVMNITKLLMTELDINTKGVDSVKKTIYDFYVKCIKNDYSLDSMFEKEYKNKSLFLADAITYISFKIDRYINLDMKKPLSYNKMIKEVMETSPLEVKKEFSEIIKDKKTKLKRIFDEACINNIKFITKYDSFTDFKLIRYKIKEDLFLTNIKLNIEELNKELDKDVEAVINSKVISNLLTDINISKTLYQTFSERENNNYLILVSDDYLIKKKNKEVIFKNFVGNLKQSIIFGISYASYIDNKDIYEEYKDLGFKIALKITDEMVELRRLNNIAYILIDYVDSPKIKKIISESNKYKMEVVALKGFNADILNVSKEAVNDR